MRSLLFLKKTLMMVCLFSLSYPFLAFLRMYSTSVNKESGNTITDEEKRR
jgi:hypothetical protein